MWVCLAALDTASVGVSCSIGALLVWVCLAVLDTASVGVSCSIGHC